MTRLASFMAVLVLTIGLAGGWFVASGPGPEMPQPAAGASPPAAGAGKEGVNGARGAQVPEFVTALARELKAEFGDRIDDITIRARFHDIRSDVIERFPERGERWFRRALRIAFPERADAILELIAKLARYNDWLLTENRTLMELSPIERSGMLWDKRREIFGDQADMLWAEERAAVSEQRQQVQATLERLGQADNISLEETLHQLRSELDETFDGAMRQLINDSGAVSGAFFTLESVQEKLASLPPEQRQARIDEMRRQLGFSEDAVERMRERDQARERRWSRGKAYMAEREEVMAQFQEESERERALQELRREYFEHEAETIRKEEATGFYRYERPRVYGRN